MDQNVKIIKRTLQLLLDGTDRWSEIISL